jgi:mono/diheme cytochrome c family protein
MREGECVISFGVSQGDDMNLQSFRLSGVLLLLVAILFFVSLPAHAQGEAAAVFKAKCAVCHGQDATGNVPMGKTLKVPDLHSAEVQKQTDAQLTDSITNGKGKMPAYKGKLTEEQIKQLVAYTRELAKKK